MNADEIAGEIMELEPEAQAGVPGGREGGAGPVRSRAEIIREIVRLLKATDWSDIFFVLYYLKAGE